MMNSVKVFLYYALEDEQVVNKGLMPHLNSLELQGRINLAGRHTILGGVIEKEEIEGYLNENQVILLVISPNFMSNSHCYDSVLVPAAEQHKLKKAKVIPILLSPVDYKQSPIADFKPLPENAEPIMSWQNTNGAYFNVSEGIRKILDKMPPPSPPPITSTFPTRLEDLDLKPRPPLTGHSKAISAIAFSPDEETLASASMDKTIMLWNANAPKAVHIIKEISANEKISDGLTSVAFSPDGKILASGCMDKTIKLWNSYTQQLDHTLLGHTGGVMSIAFSPDGKMLASGCVDKTIKLWDLSSKQEITTLKGHTNTIFSVAFSPDNSRLASGGKDKSVRVWDIRTGKCLHTLKRHSDAVYGVVFSSDGGMLLSGSKDKKIRAWNPYTGGELFMRSGESSIFSLAMHPGVQPLLASGHKNGEITIWDLQAKKQLYKFSADSSDAIWSLAFSANGLKLASGSGEKVAGVSIWGSNKVTPQGPSFPRSSVL